ncbi:MAG: DUF2334 domain-containing protein [Vicinamibacterales bacterium]
MKTLTLLALLLGHVFLNAQTLLADQRIVVVFRYDDYSSTSRSDLEDMLLEAFWQRGLALTIAVMPFGDPVLTSDSGHQDAPPLSPEKVIVLRNAIENGTVDVALHGFSHEATARWQGNTEFRGLDYISQLLRIEKGKSRLESALGVEVTTFIPPFNSFDLTTLKAVETLGFAAFSAHVDEAADIKDASPLHFIPATTDLGGLRIAVESARTLSDPQPLIVVLFHPTDFLEVDANQGSVTYQEFVDSLEWLTGQPDVDVMSMSQAGKVVNDLSARRFREFTDRFLLRLVPPMLQERYHFPVGAYYLDQGWGLKARLLLALFVLYGTIGLTAGVVVFVGAAALWHHFPFPARPLLGIGPSLFVLFLAYELRNAVVRYEGALILVVLFGASIGAFYSYRQTRRASSGARDFKFLSHGPLDDVG